MFFELRSTSLELTFVKVDEVPSQDIITVYDHFMRIMFCYCKQTRKMIAFLHFSGFISENFGLMFLQPQGLRNLLEFDIRLPHIF